MVVVEGPRFSTRAESESFSQQGWSLVNMTGMPEAVLARELAMCYSVLALVTDYDAGVDRETAVSQAEVFATFQRGLATMRELLTEAILRLPNPRTCACAALPPGVPTGHIPSATERSTAPSGSG
jgi:5'-methylthioadenosine phosphorylase